MIRYCAEPSCNKPFQGGMAKNPYCFECSVKMFKTNQAYREKFTQQFKQSNSKDQRSFFKSGTVKPPPETKGITVTLDNDMLERLIRLCHPDKHNGSEGANKATKFLLKLRR